MDRAQVVFADIWRAKTGRTGLVLVILILTLALIGPLVSADPNKINVADRFLGPSATHLLGTDNLGRDLFSRTAQGTRAALVISLAVQRLRPESIRGTRKRRRLPGK